MHESQEKWYVGPYETIDYTKKSPVDFKNINSIKAKSVQDIIKMFNSDLTLSEANKLSEANSAIKSLLNISPVLFNPDEDLSILQGVDKTKLAEIIQNKFQNNIKSYYHKCWLWKKVEELKLKNDLQNWDMPLDEQALNLITKESVGINGWTDMLPNFHTERDWDKKIGLNCTLASALLHIALEHLWFKNIRTTLRKWHHVVTREMEDGWIKLYDPTSSKDDNWYFKIFTKDQIKHKKEVYDKWYSFSLSTKDEDKIGWFSKLKNGEYQNTFFSYDTPIKMDISIALGNLSEIKDTTLFDVDKYSMALIEFLKKNNKLPLSDDIIEKIIKLNYQPIEELKQSAILYFKLWNRDTTVPNPYDFLQSEYLIPANNIKDIPNPIDFNGFSERYKQAQNLLKKYPALNNLDFQSIKKQLKLFDGYDYL